MDASGWAASLMRTARTLPMPGTVFRSVSDAAARACSARLTCSRHCCLVSQTIIHRRCLILHQDIGTANLVDIDDRGVHPDHGIVC